MRRLRIHHLLCIPLFVGEGYSDGFSRNMDAMIKLLRENAKQPLQAVCGCDIICEGCPNLMKDGSCINSTPAQKENGLSEGQRCGVDEKDAVLAQELKITPGQVYTYRELTEIVQRQLTREIFDSSCSNCQWYQQGLCSFEKWRVSVNKE